MIKVIRHTKNFTFALLVLLSFLTVQAYAVTDTIFVQKRITDTIYVVSPPDTVYTQESVIKKYAGDSTAVDEVPYKKNEFLTEYVTDTIPPAINFYIGIITLTNPLLIAFGILGLDFDIEKENASHGSFIFNLQSIMLPFEFTLDDEQSWSGYRSLWSPGIGYRHYFGPTSKVVINSKKLAVKHRNIPLNSSSAYIQGMAGPTLKFAYDGPYKSDCKKASLDAGFSVEGSAGFILNTNNLLFNFGITVGYQYWPSEIQGYLLMNKGDEDERFVIIPGMTTTGVFFKTELKLGF